MSHDPPSDRWEELGVAAGAARWTPERVEQRVAEDFPPAERAAARAALTEYAATDASAASRARVQLACLWLAQGDLAQLRWLVAQAGLDYRDVLGWAAHRRTPAGARRLVAEVQALRGAAHDRAT